MERILSPILSLVLFFGTLVAHAVPAGSPQDYNLRTTYLCQANGVAIQNKQTVVSSGQGIDEVKFVASPGRNQTLTFGNGREHMIWPRVANGTFMKSLNVLSKGSTGAYKIMQEVDLGSSLKTKSSISLVAKDLQGEERPVSCKIEMEWVKKAK